MFVKQLHVEPVFELAGATLASRHDVPNPRVKEAPTYDAETGLWHLTFEYAPGTPLGASDQDQDDAYSLLATMWAARVGPDDARLVDVDHYANSARGNLPFIVEPERTRIDELLGCTVQHVEAYVESTYGPNGPPRAWIHGDAHYDNLVRRPDGSTMLIDFEHHGLGAVEIDVSHYVCAALTRPTADRPALMPTTFLARAVEDGIDLELTWLLLGVQAARSAAWLTRCDGGGDFDTWISNAKRLAATVTSSAPWEGVRS